MLLPRSTHYSLIYQSHDIGFSEWINLCTLCLAPLIAHVLVGAPDPVIMGERRPPWADRICYYNPTSIVWRYFIITDRRIRTRNWTVDDMVATNSILWSDSGWYNPSALYKIPEKQACSNLPRKGRISLLSTSALKTLLVALQGVQAVYLLVRKLVNGKHWLSMATIFLPIAILGLLRLPAAPWLFDESGHFNNTAYSFEPRPEGLLPDDGSEQSASRHTEMFPQSSARAIFVRAYFLLCLLVGLTLALMHFFLPFYTATKAAEEYWWPTTLLVDSFFSCFLAGVTMAVMFVYIVKGKTESTVLPCLGSLWYRVYTFFLFLCGLFMIVVSAVETRKTAEGEFSVYPRRDDY